jgi:hypothetical protein
MKTLARQLKHPNAEHWNDEMPSQLLFRAFCVFRRQ